MRIFVTISPSKEETDAWTDIRAKLERVLKHMAALDDKITQLQADVAAEGTVVDSAVTLIQGFPALIAAAVAAAQAAGATDAQLQSFADLSTAIEAKTKVLADAVSAGTPVAPAA